MTLSDRMARAEDYVFGLMDEEERRRAERDMEMDGEFRECVMVLAERLRRLREQPTSPISISDDAWYDISRRIASMPQMLGSETAARMAGVQLGSSGPVRKGMLRLRRPYAHQFAGWRGAVVAGLLAAALAVGYLAGQAVGTTAPPQAMALLSDGDGAAGAIVEVQAGKTLRFLPLAPFEVPEGKVLQLWADGAPVAVLDRMTTAVLDAPALPAPEADQAFAVTLEDAPGVATGDAVGPVIFSGQAAIPPR